MYSGFDLVPSSHAGPVKSARPPVLNAFTFFLNYIISFKYPLLALTLPEISTNPFTNFPFSLSLAGIVSAPFPKELLSVV
jgi:hypothetical protein